MISASLLTTT